ncbi:MAG: SDR family oxidoreductase [Rhodobacteraceae bacterium]|nr:SDR family oxidoreductase [Paracoccaceae bacterium]
MTMTANFPDLAGKSVFITGGGSGIGAALTEGFVAQGAQVAFVQRSDARAFCDTIASKHGSRPLFLPCDITDTPALQAAVAQAAQAHGAVQVLVNNAANDQRQATFDITEEFWDQAQAINLKPYFFAAQAVLPAMKAAGRGVIVNFTSISYLMGKSGYPAYVSANAGITGLTRALAREFGPLGIRANALAPGWVLTEKQMQMWATPETLAAHMEKQCLKEHLKAQDMVDAVLFMASDASRMMTGQTMVVDGGVAVTG